VTYPPKAHNHHRNHHPHQVLDLLLRQVPHQVHYQVEILPLLLHLLLLAHQVNLLVDCRALRHLILHQRLLANLHQEVFTQVVHQVTYPPKAHNHHQSRHPHQVLDLLLHQVPLQVHHPAEILPLLLLAHQANLPVNCRVIRHLIPHRHRQVNLHQEVFTQAVHQVMFLP